MSMREIKYVISSYLVNIFTVHQEYLSLLVSDRILIEMNFNFQFDFTGWYCGSYRGREVIDDLVVIQDHRSSFRFHLD